MKKIDPAKLTKIVENILSDSYKSNVLATRVLDAIRRIEAEAECELPAKNYLFICPVCGENTYIREHRFDSSVLSVVSGIGEDSDGKQVVEYGYIDPKPTAPGVVNYSCFTCGHVLSDRELSLVMNTTGEGICSDPAGLAVIPRQGGDNYGVRYSCPACEFPEDDTLTFDMSYCWNCGARLDWSGWA